MAEPLLCHDCLTSEEDVHSRLRNLTNAERTSRYSNGRHRSCQEPRRSTSSTIFRQKPGCETSVKFPTRRLAFQTPQSSRAWQSYTTPILSSTCHRNVQSAGYESIPVSSIHPEAEPDPVHLGTMLGPQLPEAKPGCHTMPSTLAGTSCNGI